MSQTQTPVVHRYTIRTVERALLGGIGAYLYPRSEHFAPACWFCVAATFEDARTAALLERARLEGISETL